MDVQDTPKTVGHGSHSDFLDKAGPDPLDPTEAGRPCCRLWTLDGVPSPPPVDRDGGGAVEWMAGPAHGTWVLRGTPTPADLLMRHHDDGWRLEDIAEHYGWDEGLIGALIAFGEAHRAGVGGAGRRSA